MLDRRNDNTLIKHMRPGLGVRWASRLFPLSGLGSRGLQKPLREALAALNLCLRILSAWMVPPNREGDIPHAAFSHVAQQLQRHRKQRKARAETTDRVSAR